MDNNDWKFARRVPPRWPRMPRSHYRWPLGTVAHAIALAAILAVALLFQFVEWLLKTFGAN